MKKTLEIYLPIHEHRQAYIEKSRLELAEWIEKQKGSLFEMFEDEMLEILSSSDPVNPEFGVVQQVGILQLSWISSAIDAVYQNHPEIAEKLISKTLGGLALQIPLDLYSYRDSIEFFGPDNIGFGQDLNLSLLLACTSLWLGPAPLMQQAHNWFQTYRNHDHFLKYPADASFCVFALWMLSTQAAGSAQPLEHEPTRYGPYLALIEKFNAPGALAEEIREACDFHLYLSNDFPGADR